MLLGLDAQIWLALGFVLALPVGVVGLLKLILRRHDPRQSSVEPGLPGCF